MSSTSSSAGFTPDIGVRLREARKRLGLSQDELAQRLGISRRSVINYEAETNPVLLEFLDQLAQLGADIQYILFGNTNPNQGQTLDVSTLEEALDWADTLCVDSRGRPFSSERKARFVCRIYEYLTARKIAESSQDDVKGALEKIIRENAA